MTTLATVPVYPAPKYQARVVFTLTGVGANYVRVWATAAPEGTAHAAELKESTKSRVLVYVGDGGDAHPWLFSPEKGGKWSFLAQEYTRGSGYGGGYEDDPSGAETEAKVGTEAALAMFIGQRMTSRVGIAPDNAELVLWVWDATIRPTTLALHGEKTPAVVATAPTPRAKAAVEAATVTAALTALEGAPVATAIGTLSAIVSGMRTKLMAHFIMLSSVHEAQDLTSVLTPENAATPTPKELPSFVNEALAVLRRHMTNDSGAGVGTATGLVPAPPAWHRVGGVSVADFTFMPLYRSVSDVEDAYAALADLYRAFEGHRVNLAAHGAADTTNVLAALPLLLQLHKAFLTVLAALDPAVPAAQSTGAMKLISQAGFVES